jgi:Bacterial Ig-like domain (group 3)/FG-GAP-like repeat/Abnormal spindle-like microcephaly-assoc'd, ASPM-SPD-2-Hydin
MFMRSRVLFSSVCVFAVLVSVQVFAQSFAPAVPYGSGGNGPNGVAVADLRGSGRLDMVVANWCTEVNCTASSVGVLLGNGDGTFQPAVAYGSGGHYADSIAVADVNGDGKPDILVGNCGHPKITNCLNGNVGVLLGNGDGTFQAVANFPLGGFGAVSVAVADVNGDNKPDLLVATGSASGSWVGVLLGNGDGTFQTVVTYSTGGLAALSVAVADVNGDSKPDLVVANWCTDANCTASSVGVLLGNGDGTFQTVVNYDSGGIYANSVVIGDVNGDGKLDVVVGNGSNSPTDALGNVAVLLGNGDGTFQTAVPYNRDGYGASSVALTDMNGDGKPDLVVANCSTTAINCAHADGDLAVLLGNGNGTFRTAVSYGSGGSTPFGVAVGDVNGDGRPDIVAANCAGKQCGSGPGELGVLLNTTLTATKTALTSSVNPSKPGQAVTFTATVTPQPGFGEGSPTGTVSFLDGAINIGKVPLNPSGVATLTTSTLPLGTNSITATYSGDTNFSPSASSQLQQLVQGAGVSLSPISLNFGDQTVGVASAAKTVMLQNTGNANLSITSIQITGANNVDFKSGTCASSLSPNTSCQISVIFTPAAAGTRNATLSIADNASGNPQSVALTGIGTTAPNYTVSANPTSVTVNPGSAANYVITLTPLNGYDGTVTINCPSSLPSGVSCNTPSIAPGKTQATLTVSTTGPSAALNATPNVNSRQGASNLWASLGGVGLVGMILAGDWKKRNRRGMGIMLGILALVMILAMVGCGGGSISGGAWGGGGTPAATYPLQVVATGTAGTNGGSTAPHPIPVTLVVN